MMPEPGMESLPELCDFQRSQDSWKAIITEYLAGTPEELLA